MDPSTEELLIESIADDEELSSNIEGKDLRVNINNYEMENVILQDEDAKFDVLLNESLPDTAAESLKTDVTLVKEEVSISNMIQELIGCELCDLKLPVAQLRSHILKEHCGTESPSENAHSMDSCPLCDNTFANKSAMKKHFELHSSNPQTCYICKNDGVMDIFSHVHKEHKAITNLVCFVCDKKFCTLRMLSDHFRGIHLGETVKCPQCDKRVSLSNYHRHIKEKHENRRKACPHCGKEFAPSNFTRHIRQVHDNEMGKCPYCEKLLSKSNISHHIKGVHLKITENCDICNEEVRIGILSIHKRNVHGLGKREVTPRGPNFKLRRRNSELKGIVSETSIQVGDKCFYFSSI